MLHRIDALIRLGARAESAQSLASLLPASEVEVQGVLDSLVQEGVVSAAPAGYPGDPSKDVTYYLLTHEGKTLYQAVLDRYAADLIGLVPMPVAERFVIALAEDAPAGMRTALFDLLDEVPCEQHDYDRRKHALRVAESAIGVAEQALDADEGGRVGAAAGLRSLPRHSADDFGYAARMMRAEYAPKVADATLRDVVETAAAACEAAWDLRELGPRNRETNTAPSHRTDDSSYFEVADGTAVALKTLGRSRGGIDIVAEARKVIETLSVP